MTGHELLAWLQGHPGRLDLNVVLIAPDDWTGLDDGTLKDVDIDRFETDEPEVICLSTHERGPNTGIPSWAFSNDTGR